MLFKKMSVEFYVDRILDACLDTAVAVPEEFDTEETIDKYNKQHDMEMKYIWLGMWMYDNHINLDKDIEKYNKKYLRGSNSREASYQVLNSYFKQWNDRQEK